jgi:hypothetical protein
VKLTASPLLSNTPPGKPWASAAIQRDSHYGKL